MFLLDSSKLIAVVKTAGSIINRAFGEVHVVTTKDDNTPVTRIDKEINTLFLHFAKEHRLGFIGEEGNGDSTQDWVLYVDPLDGTTAFIRGIPTSTVVASIMFLGMPIISVIHNPMTGQTWCAKRGEGCFYSRNGSPEKLVHVDGYPRTPYRAAICAWPRVDMPFSTLQEAVLQRPEFADQPMGAFALGGGLIASGTLHATAISATSAVETAAMSLIVCEAGGVVVDLDGNPIKQFQLGEHKGKADFLLPRGAVLACNMQVLEKLLVLYPRS